MSDTVRDCAAARPFLGLCPPPLCAKVAAARCATAWSRRATGRQVLGYPRLTNLRLTCPTHLCRRLGRRVRLVRRLEVCRTRIPEACAGYRCTHIGSQTGRFFLLTLSPRTLRKYLWLFGSINSVIHALTGLCANQNMPCVWRAKSSEIGDSGGGSLERGSGSVEAVARRHVTRPLPLGAPSSQPRPNRRSLRRRSSRVVAPPGRHVDHAVVPH